MYQTLASANKYERSEILSWILQLLSVILISALRDNKVTPQVDRKKDKIQVDRRLLNFFQLKSKLINAPILAHQYFMKSFTLDINACDQSIGAVIQQIIDGDKNAIAYASRTLSKTER